MGKTKAKPIEDQDAARRELARGTLELVVLALVARERRYGYELMTAAIDATGGALEVKEGTLYPLLHRLEDSGTVVTEWEAEGRAAPRKYYAITPAGRERLASLAAHWKSLAAGMERLFEGRKI